MTGAAISGVRSCTVISTGRPIPLPSEASEFAPELRQIFLGMARTPGTDTLSGECSPLLDVFETDARIEIAVDLPAIDPGRGRSRSIPIADGQPVA